MWFTCHNYIPKEYNRNLKLELIRDQKIGKREVAHNYLQIY